jgi:hypothetical protein
VIVMVQHFFSHTNPGRETWDFYEGETLDPATLEQRGATELVKEWIERGRLAEVEAPAASGGPAAFEAAEGIAAMDSPENR